MGLTGYREYVVRRRPEGKLRALRIALLVLYVLLPLAICLPLALYRLYPLLLIVLLLDGLLEFFTWPLTRVEYEYVMDGTGLSFAVIRGRSSRRTLCSVPLKQLSAVAPADEANRGKWRAPADKTWDLRSSRDVPYGYFLRFTDSDGRRCLLFFDGFRPLVESVRFRNAPVTVLRDGLPDYE